MSPTHFIARLLGIERVNSIERMELSFAAPWAQQSAAWVFLGCLLLGAVAGGFYYRLQPRGRPRARILLGVLRGLALCLLLVFLADPILIARFTHTPKPWLWMLFDGTDSMAIEDEYPSAERAKLHEAVGMKDEGTSATKPSRSALVQSFLRKPKDNLARQLAEKYRLKTFLLDRPDGVREFSNVEKEISPADPGEWAGQLTTGGQVTALGKAFEDLSLRHATGQLAGLLVFSDFDQNSGPPPLASAKKLGVPVYTVGVGAEAASDLAVDLQAPLLMKKAERSNLVVTLRNSGLTGQSVSVKLSARPIAASSAVVLDETVLPIGEKTVQLDLPDQPVEFPWVPAETGRFALVAEAFPLEGETITQNNRAEREVDIRDDFLRLMFVEYEPTWEWRFIKEVFHRDKLVGMRGFRTFLRSADPNVRRTNELFLPTLTPKRSEFFANDVIFLGDMPASTLSTRFCEMTKEFVGKFGGGLVVVSGPRFGPAQLANTPLADMLPVIADPGAKVRGDRDFSLRLTPDAAAYDFMQLGANESENLRAWGNLGQLPWYQPVSRLHPFGTALAVHPAETCVDGRTLQPLIAVRRYGRGEVIYLGFNETWRLRKKYGELYYRQFWGQMIHRLGLSHALGSQKRFVVRTDRQQYQPDDKVLLTVEAYDANYEPLTEDDLPQRTLTAEMTLPGTASDGGKTVQTLAVPQFRDGVFETRVIALQPGEHRVTVKDPVTNESTEVFFQVSNVSVERRSAVRNTPLQREIATETGGQAYDLTNVNSFLKDFSPPEKSETTIQVFPVWNTWLGFLLVLGVLFAEWLIRKLVNLA